MNEKMYLDGQVGEHHITLKELVFISGVIQFAFECSSFQRPHINGHTVGLHITQHSAAPFIRHLLTPDHVMRHCLIWYWFLEHDVAEVITCADTKKFHIKHALKYKIVPTKEHLAGDL